MNEALRRELSAPLSPAEQERLKRHRPSIPKSEQKKWCKMIAQIADDDDECNRYFYRWAMNYPPAPKWIAQLQKLSRAQNY